MMSLAQPRLLLFTAIVLSFLAGEGFSQEAANNNAELSGKKLLKQVRDQLASLPLKTGQRPDFADQSNRQCIVFLSLARPTQGAIVGLGVGAKVDEAVTDASVHLRSQATMEDLSSGKLKLDVATFQSDLPTAEDLGPLRIVTGPFGMWFAQDNVIYLPEKGDPRRLSAGVGTRPYAYTSWIEKEKDKVVPLRFGNLEKYNVTPQSLLHAAIAGGDYLVRHMRLDGRFDYSYDPLTNEVSADYNLLRHAGTCYALLELQQVVNEGSSGEKGDQKYLETARRGMTYLFENHCQPAPKPEEGDFQAIVSPDKDAKLGGAALAMLATLKYQEVSGDERWLPLTKQLGRFLIFQQEESGRFESRYFYGEPDPVLFDSIYYPGEAILALARLAKVDPAGPWLETAKRGADWLIDVRDVGKKAEELPADHWLLMGINELSTLTDDPRYVQHAQKITQSICHHQRLDDPQPEWIGTFYTPPRSTPTATRSEALVAMINLARTRELESAEYLRRLKLAIEFQLRCQIIPENAIYLPRPDQAMGGFRASLEDWEVRIDYVQHNISSLLGLRELLESE